MSVERKAIASNIENLISLGFDIIQVNRKGYYLGQESSSQVKFNFGGCSFSSKVINRRQSVNLAKKLYSFLSKNERKSLIMFIKLKVFQNLAINRFFTT